MRTALIFALVLTPVLITRAQTATPKAAGELHGFETSRLTAELNGDRDWMSRFAGRKLKVLPPSEAELAEREAAIIELIRSSLGPREMKVRITGTITFLTNDPKQNRSVNFLDTFNKVGGKWQVIASSTSVNDSQNGQ
jgi:hypothetical protein